MTRAPRRIMLVAPFTCRPCCRLQIVTKSVELLKSLRSKKKELEDLERTNAQCVAPRVFGAC